MLVRAQKLADTIMMMAVVTLRMVVRMTVKMVVRKMETAYGSVPRRCFDIRQTVEIYVQRHDRSYLMEKPWVLAAEPMA